MKLAKIIVLVLIVGAVAGMSYFLKPRGDQINPSGGQQQRSSVVNRGDDPTYAEEVRTLTATVRESNEQRKIEEEDLKKKLRTLENQLRDEQRKNDLSGNDAKRVKELEEQLSSLKTTMTQSLDPIKQTISRLAANQNTKRTPAKQASNGMAGYSTITPFGNGQTVGVAGVNVGSTLLGAQQRAEDKTYIEQQKSKPIPVFTLHDGAVLAGSRSVTPLIGRVPNGGSVSDPFRFRLVTGAENIMANGHKVPGVKNAIWSGYAVGVREESCVRGYIDSVTFVFEDGTISTTSENKSSSLGQNAPVTQSLGFITGPGGVQCIGGMLVNNASSYLKDRTVAAFAEGLAAAYASAQTTVDRTSNGGLSAFVSGDTIKFGIGRGVSRSAAEVAQYLRQRQENAFDVIYYPSNQSVQIMLEREIRIDYDPNGRKVSYDYASTGANYDTNQLD